MYKISEEFHERYAEMYDNFVKIIFKDGTEKIGLFNDEFYEDSSILVSCEVIKIEDIERMELVEDEKWLKSVEITMILLAIICIVFWKIEWISSWKEVAALYGIMAAVITISTLITYIRTKIIKK